jgi:multiple sugar transport system permease protein
LISTIRRPGIDLLKFLPVVLILILVGIAPIGNALYNSFFHDYYGERSFAGLDNFKVLTEDEGFSYSLKITVLWSLLNCILGLIFGFLIAVKLSHKTRYSKLLYGFLLVPWGIPVYILVPLWRALIHGNGGESILTFLVGIKINLLTDPVASFISAMVISLWLTVPLTAFVFLGALKKLPKNIEEAARIDGAGRAHIARFIYLPCIRDSLYTMAVLNFIKAFKEFNVVFLLTAGGPPMVAGITGRHIIGATTTLGIFLFEIFNEIGDFGITSSYAVVMAGVISLIMIIWFIIKNGNKDYRKVKMITAAAQVFLGGPFGWLWGIGYLSGLWKDVLFIIAACAQAIFMLFGIVQNGFLAAFHPGILISLFALMLRKRTHKSSKSWDSARPIRGSETIWKIGSGGISGFMIVSSVVIIFLLIWMSVSKLNTCYIDSFLPRFRTMRNFYTILFEENILRFFFNTLVVAGITAILVPFFTFPAAAGLAGKKGKLPGAFLTFIQIVGITGGMHSLIPLYSLFASMRLINSYIPIILIYITHSIPFSIFTIKAYLDDIPSSFKDAARLEGLSSLKYITRILVPVSIPAVTTSIMVAFMSAWNGFLVPLLFLNDDSKYTISVKLFSMVGSVASGNPRWNLFAAASIFNCLIIGLVFLRFRKPVQTTSLKDHED